MGLFTGISLVTFVEVAYWILRVITFGLFGTTGSTEERKVSAIGVQDQNKKGQTAGVGSTVFVGSNGFSGYS
jgi:hypothetical protein